MASRTIARQRAMRQHWKKHENATSESGNVCLLPKTGRALELHYAPKKRQLNSNPLAPSSHMRTSKRQNTSINSPFRMLSSFYCFILAYPCLCSTESVLFNLLDLSVIFTWREERQFTSRWMLIVNWALCSLCLQRNISDLGGANNSSRSAIYAS